MISPSDSEYQLTKQIMLGKACITPILLPLVEFINTQFGVTPVNIVYDTIDNGNRPRLGVFFEYEWEKQIFNEQTTALNYDSEKQKIISLQFEKIIQQYKKNPKRWSQYFLKNYWRCTTYQPENIFVYFSAFEPVALWDANESIPISKIKQMQTEIDDENLWEISKGFTDVTFFLFTDEQVKQYENSEIKRIWSDKYFDLLASYNLFGYYKRESFSIRFDSKENFEKNYQSNWYYYYK